MYAQYFFSGLPTLFSLTKRQQPLFCQRSRGQTWRVMPCTWTTQAPRAPSNPVNAHSTTVMAVGMVVIAASQQVCCVDITPKCLRTPLFLRTIYEMFHVACPWGWHQHWPRGNPPPPPPPYRQPVLFRMFLQVGGFLFLNCMLHTFKGETNVWCFCELCFTSIMHVFVLYMCVYTSVW